ncbi:unnamed protein product [Arctogadus glacialis]
MRNMSNITVPPLHKNSIVILSLKDLQTPRLVLCTDRAGLRWGTGLRVGQEAMAHQFAVNPRPQKGLTAGLKKLLQELCSGQVQEELKPCADGCHASGYHLRA